MTPNKSLDDKSAGFYIGVFGHHENKYLHGKVYINAGNDGKYTSKIELVNGDELHFKAQQGGSNIHFIGNRGSFDFNIVNFNRPSVSNLIIDGIDDAYMVTKKSTVRGGGGLILLGTYEETGNESGFYGNFDMIGTGIPIAGIPVLAEAIDVMIVSHKGNRGPFLDFGSDINPLVSCVPDLPGMLIDFLGTGPFSTVDGIAANGQTSTIHGLPLTWDVALNPSGYHDETCAPLGPDGGGDWSWGGRTGKIYITPVAPTITNISTSSDSFFGN